MTHVLAYDTSSRTTDPRQGFIARMAKVVADYRLYVSTVEELRQLSDRELSDLGIYRSSIRDIARESVYGA